LPCKHLSVRTSLNKGLQCGVRPLAAAFPERLPESCVSQFRFCVGVAGLGGIRGSAIERKKSSRKRPHSTLGLYDRVRRRRRNTGNSTSGKPIEIQYHFVCDGEGGEPVEKRCFVRLDPDTMETRHSTDPPPPPGWAQLEVRQCDVCPLKQTEHPYCPAGLSFCGNPGRVRGNREAFTPPCAFLATLRS
jgi:hypothetical protein